MGKCRNAESRNGETTGPLTTDHGLLTARLRTTDHRTKGGKGKAKGGTGVDFEGEQAVL
jgi:hypothetical protein